MSLLVDDINKIIYLTPHKCGHFTISTFIKRSQKNICDIGYYSETYTKTFLNEYIYYYKVLILRDPYKRFISGFLQDCLYNHNEYYKTIKKTFKEYCKFLLDNKNELTTHLVTQYSEINDIVELFECKFDKIINTEQIDDMLIEINNKYNLGVKIEKGNEKKYDNCKSNVDIINEMISNIANGAQFPSYEYFYDEEIKNIIKNIYEKDFELLKKFKIHYNDIFLENRL